MQRHDEGILKKPIKVGEKYRVKEGRRFVRAHGGHFVLRNFPYKDVKYDPDGWVDAAEFLPGKFDLVTLKLDKGPYKRGWWQGNAWEGYKITPEDKILYWKKHTGDV